ncbi:intracellular protein transport protein USO1-like [Drosophila busckii]|uniref:intracellular protein transport protein USO1-like n=1 Tax=Drosophila busckii TaxID=30019 RepID=UPI0014328190|nr:intracellular protein transport protein USO1-like [Drosophila busckii]
MYKPRRTSEFHDEIREDGGFAKTRQTRSTLRTSSTPMNKAGMLSQWQLQTNSRATYGQERGTPMRTGPPITTAKRSALSLSVTPLRAHQASSVERAGPLHSDKKWVQEQTQIISEQLNEMMHIKPIAGFSTDFFSRGAASLRQMTKKQFVGIVNYFLQFIWPNRKIVDDTKHVEDITSALAKLNYPYQVNKSWLITPTTQSSFGHVIVLFDFLKDFVPELTTEHEAEFPFMETNEHPSYLQNTQDSVMLSTTAGSTVQLDEEINSLLFSKSAECFALWDDNKSDEYALLKRKISDQIVQRICGLPDTDTLDADCAKLIEQLQVLDKQLQVPNNLQAELHSARTREQQLQHELQTLHGKIKSYKAQIKELNARAAQNANNIKTLHQNLKQVKRHIETQKYTVEQVEQLQVQLVDLKNKTQFHVRQLNDLGKHSDKQQVRLSRVKKELLDHVEKYNKQAQNIALDSDIDKTIELKQLVLMLSFPPQLESIQDCRQRLTKLSALLKQHNLQLKERLRQLELYYNERMSNNEQLEARLTSSKALLKTQEQQLAELQQMRKAKASKWQQYLQQLNDRKAQQATSIIKLQQQNDELTRQLESLKKNNLGIVSAGELRQQEQLKAKDKYIKEQTALLSEIEDKAQQLRMAMEQNEKLLNKAEELLDSIQLTPYKDQLADMFNKKKES